MNWKVIGLAAALLVAVTAVAQAELPPVADLAVTGRPLYMKLEWSPVDTASPGELDYYKVYRSETQGDAGDAIGTTTDPTYFDQTAAYHLFYWYEVHPVDTLGTETMTGNNQAGDSLMTLGDPGIEITSHPACSVVEDEEAPMSGTWQYAIGVDVNGYGAWMSIDPEFADGEWNVTVPIDLGPNDLLATATGTEGRSATDNVRIARIPVGSGDPTLAFTSHADGDFVAGDLAVTLEGEVANGACVTINGGDYLDLTWAPAYDLATWAQDVTLSYGANVFEAHAMGSMNREVSETITLYAVPTGDPEVAITSPEDMFVTVDEMVTVDGTCFAVGWVELNGEEVTVTFDPATGQGTWMYEDLALDLGANVITAVGFGFAANDTASITVYRVEGTPPSVTITSPTDGAEISGPSDIEVAGTSANCGYLAIGDDTFLPDATTGDWAYDFTLEEGYNTIVVTGYGADGQTATDSVTVYYWGETPPGPPSVEITSPEDGADLSGPASVDVVGTSADCMYLMVNGEMVEPDIETGDWDYAGFPLSDGWNTIVATGYGSEGQTAVDSVQVYYWGTEPPGPPEIAITSPSDGDATGENQIDVTGTSAYCSHIVINGETVYPDGNGGWAYEDHPLVEGANTITATGYGADDQTATATVTVYYFTQPPEVSITSPVDGATLFDQPITVSGTSEYCVYIEINDESVTPDANGDWTYSGYPLDLGENTITATGHGVGTASASVTVTLEEEVKWQHHKIFTPNGDDYNDLANFDVETGATVSIYTLGGQLVIELDNAQMGPDGYVIRWDGKDMEGENAPAGLYIYEIEDGDETDTGTIGLAR